MNEAAAKLGGTRVIVSGLGVGVRTGDEFVLFDRLDESDPPDLLQPRRGACVRIGCWLAAGQGISAAPASLGLDADRAGAAGRYHHLGFVAADYEATIGRIGVSPGETHVRISALRRRWRGCSSRSSAKTICPMPSGARCIRMFGRASRASARSAAWTSCRCHRRKSANTGMDVTLEQRAGGMTGLRLAIREPDSNALVRDFPDGPRKDSSPLHRQSRPRVLRACASGAAEGRFVPARSSTRVRASTC